MLAQDHFSHVDEIVSSNVVMYMSKGLVTAVTVPSCLCCDNCHGLEAWSQSGISVAWPSVFLVKGKFCTWTELSVGFFPSWKPLK